MTGLNADSISTEPTQFKLLRSMDGKPAARRICRACPADISHRHGNAAYCAHCSTRMHIFYHDRARLKREEIPARAVVHFMQEHAPRALADIKARIREARLAKARM